MTNPETINAAKITIAADLIARAKHNQDQHSDPSTTDLKILIDIEIYALTNELTRKAYRGAGV